MTPKSRSWQTVSATPVSIRGNHHLKSRLLINLIRLQSNGTGLFIQAHQPKRKDKDLIQ